MKNLTHSLLTGFFTFLLLIIFSQTVLAQDPTKVDSKHYKVVFENEQVRVLRITYDAGEKSVMHLHPDGVAVFLTEGEARFTLPDGKTKDITFNDGDVIWVPEGSHQPKNTGNKPYELIQIEMKK